MINYIILGLNCLAFLLVLIGLLYIFRSNRYEEKIVVKSAFNIILFGLVVLAGYVAFNAVKYADILFHDKIVGIIPKITGAVVYSGYVVELVFIPLIAICFLVAVAILVGKEF